MSKADIKMGENIFSYPFDLEADDDFMDVSLETTPRDGSRDANMESGVFRRGRWRKPLAYLTATHGEEDFPSTERIVSMVMTDHVLEHEYDTGLSVTPCVTYHASASLSTDIAGLIDGGANGGLANPTEMRLISYCYPPRHINITGVGGFKYSTVEDWNLRCKGSVERWELRSHAVPRICGT